MARNNRRSARQSNAWSTRHSPPSALAHTVDLFGHSDGYTPAPAAGDFDPLDTLVFGVRTPPVRTPLIRTVLIERGSENFSHYPDSRLPSPVASERATGRSSDRQTRSPFLNATMVTPQLSERALVCARRGIRREVLFAKRRTGKGSRSPRKPKSKWSC